MWVGIDVAKDELVVHLRRAEDHLQETFANHTEGISHLLKWLKKHKGKGSRACLEATGVYGLEAASALYKAAYTVHVVNPAAVAAYASSRLHHQKNDLSDAALLADFCRTQELPAWTPPPPAWYELREMVRQLDNLHAMHTQEGNRLKSGLASLTVKATLQAHVAFLQAQIDDLKAHIQDHIDHHPDLKRDQDLLASIPGIGLTTAFKLLAEIPSPMPFATPNQLVAYAGLHPVQRQSGKSKARYTPLSKRGNAALRKALYFPALAAKRHNPHMQAFCARIMQKNTSPMVAVAAAMRKLLVWAWAILKSGKPFDPQLLAQNP